MVHFTIKPIGGGFHPVITAYLNGMAVEALIDTGANVTVAKEQIEGQMRVGTIVVNVKLKQYDIPGNYQLLIGSDFMVKTGAVIDYTTKTMTFNLPKK
jgi:hypothetical protein